MDMVLENERVLGRLSSATKFLACKWAIQNKPDHADISFLLSFQMWNNLHYNFSVSIDSKRSSRVFQAAPSCQGSVYDLVKQGGWS